MSCKLVVRRFTAGMDYIGDCVNSYTFDTYLGNLVEPQGGAFVIIELSDCDFDDVEVQRMLAPNLEPTIYNNIYGLQPVSEGDEFFNELLTTGRISVTLDKLLEYKVAH